MYLCVCQTMRNTCRLPVSKSVTGVGFFSNPKKMTVTIRFFDSDLLVVPSSQGMMLDFDDFENAADNAERSIIMVMTA